MLTGRLVVVTGAGRGLGYAIAQAAGHAGAREGRHFSVRIVSNRFAGMTRVARHRLVYDSLSALMAQGIHALAIDARAPGEAGKA